MWLPRPEHPTEPSAGKSQATAARSSSRASRTPSASTKSARAGRRLSAAAQRSAFALEVLDGGPCAAGWSPAEQTGLKHPEAREARPDGQSCAARSNARPTHDHTAGTGALARFLRARRHATWSSYAGLSLPRRSEFCAHPSQPQIRYTKWCHLRSLVWLSRWPCSPLRGRLSAASHRGRRSTRPSL